MSFAGEKYGVVVAFCLMEQTPFGIEWGKSQAIEPENFGDLCVQNAGSCRITICRVTLISSKVDPNFLTEK